MSVCDFAAVCTFGALDGNFMIVSLRVNGDLRKVLGHKYLPSIRHGPDHSKRVSKRNAYTYMRRSGVAVPLYQDLAFDPSAFILLCDAV